MIEKFKKENKRKNQIIIFTCACVFLVAGVLIYQSFALFETNERFNVVSGTVEDPGDITFAFYINDEIVLEAPKKDSGLALDEKSSCTNGVSVSWNEDSWNAKLDYSNYKQENTSKVKCKLYFRNATFSDYITSCGQNDTSAAECMKKYSDQDTVNLAYDNTTDNNLRYIGSSPNNYIDIEDNVLWRVIGVMNDTDDGTGVKEARLKVIRSIPIGHYSWDTSSSDINAGYGVNEWSTSKIKTLLNTFYYNKMANQKCYAGQNNAFGICDFSNTGLPDLTKVFLDNVKWHTGSNDLEHHDGTNIDVSTFYNFERSTNLGKICTPGITSYCTDNIERTSFWIGVLALIYPSDYGYATSGNREKCYNSYLYKWPNECYENNWLSIGEYQWAIMPNAYSVSSNRGFGFGTNVGADYLYSSHAVSPTTYLKAKIKITSGAGTKENPYQVVLD